MKILYKPKLNLFVADWLSYQSHKEDTDTGIYSMKIRIDTVQTTMASYNVCQYKINTKQSSSFITYNT